MSETHFSCDTVGRELWLAIPNTLLCPETDRNICVGKQGQAYVFILPVLIIVLIFLINLSLNLYF